MCVRPPDLGARVRGSTRCEEYISTSPGTRVVDPTHAITMDSCMHVRWEWHRKSGGALRGPRFGGSAPPGWVCVRVGADLVTGMSLQ